MRFLRRFLFLLASSEDATGWRLRSLLASPVAGLLSVGLSLRPPRLPLPPLSSTRLRSILPLILSPCSSGAVARYTPGADCSPSVEGVAGVAGASSCWGGVAGCSAAGFGAAAAGWGLASFLGAGCSGFFGSGALAAFGVGFAASLGALRSILSTTLGPASLWAALAFSSSSRRLRSSSARLASSCLRFSASSSFWRSSSRACLSTSLALRSASMALRSFSRSASSASILSREPIVSWFAFSLIAMDF